MAEKPNVGLYLGTRPQKLPTRTRACGLWVSPFAQGGNSLIIDTTQVPGLSELMEHNPAGDAIPGDCLLVIISPEMMEKLRRKFAAEPYPVSGPYVASMIIDDVCQAQPELAARIGWYIEH